MNYLRKTFSVILFILAAQIISAQTVKVTGVVTAAEDKLPLPGVSIIVTGVTGVGTITDLDGKYTINVPEGKTLSFRYVGYKQQNIVVKQASVINVVLESDSKMLDEVVAIGYGTMKKSDLTGSVASIKADALKKTPSAGLDQALQGRAAGVTVNANSGQPGAAASIRIRGIGTVMGGSDPIFVVDGMITSNISFLNPNDIESTEILKDASSTAIYGSRGANGVILVTTKKGKEGKTNISFNAYTGVQNRWKKLDIMQRDEFAKTLIALNNLTSEKNYFKNYGFNKWLSAYRLGASPYYPMIKSTANPDGFDYSSVETDWQDEVFVENAPIQNYHISFDGGTAKDKFTISASYFNQEGTIIGSNYERLTVRLNSSHKVKSWLTIGENISFMAGTGRNAMNNSSSAGASILTAALSMAPWDPTHYAAGSVNKEGKDLSGQIAASSNFRNVTNPFSMVENSSPKSNDERLNGNVYADFTPIKGLVFHSALNFDISNNRYRLYKGAYEYSSYDLSLKNFIQSSMTRYSTITYENTLTYNKDFGKSSLTAMIGHTTEEFKMYSIGGSGASILNPTESNWYLSNATENRSFAGDGVGRSRMFSLLSRLHYSYDNKYMITMNFRADGSSKFTNNLWGNFPSMAVSWRMSEESWMQDIQDMDYLKLRLGWGRIGNASIGSDRFIPNISSPGPTFVGYVLGADQTLVGGAALLTIPNLGGKWETTEQINGGIDFGFLGGKLNGSIEIYQRNTLNLLLPVKAPAQVGNRYDPVANVGTLSNKGIELTLDHQNKIGKLNYSINGNVALLSNTLLSLNGGDAVYGDRSKSDKGYALFSFWGYEYEGIYKSDEEALQYLTGYTSETIAYHAGDAKFKDRNTDGKIDDNDKTNLGNPFPWFTAALNLTADYAGFDMQVFFQGVGGNQIYNAARERTEGKGDISTLSTSMRDVWSASNPTGSIPNPYGTSLNMSTSSRFLESGSYLRLKNLQLGYTLPSKITQPLDINRCRFYISASNLLTLTNYSGYDPEVGVNGVDYANYPQSRTITLGVNLDL